MNRLSKYPIKWVNIQHSTVEARIIVQISNTGQKPITGEVQTREQRELHFTCKAKTVQILIWWFYTRKCVKIGMIRLKSLEESKYLYWFQSDRTKSLQICHSAIFVTYKYIPNNNKIILDWLFVGKTWKKSKFSFENIVFKKIRTGLVFKYLFLHAY